MLRSLNTRIHCLSELRLLHCYKKIWPKLFLGGMLDTFSQQQEGTLMLIRHWRKQPLIFMACIMETTWRGKVRDCKRECGCSHPGDSSLGCPWLGLYCIIVLKFLKSVMWSPLPGRSSLWGFYRGRPDGTWGTKWSWKDGVYITAADLRVPALPFHMG